MVACLLLTPGIHLLNIAKNLALLRNGAGVHECDAETNSAQAPQKLHSSFRLTCQYHRLNNYERLSIIAVQAMKGLRRKEDAMKNEAGINKKIKLYKSNTDWLIKILHIIIQLINLSTYQPFNLLFHFCYF